MTAAAGPGSTVADVVGRAVRALGAEHVFGLVGSGNFAVTNALADAGATFVAARHECGAVVMADAYARLTGRTGVVTVHQGPGLTNAMTGIAEAAKSRTPLVVLAADTAGSAVRSNFRIDQAAMVGAVGAVAERLHSPASALADVARAWRRATSERRTVVVNMPLDVQGAVCPDAVREVSALPPAPPALPPAPAPEAVTALADLLATARRPVLLAGRGAVLADARVPLERLAARAGALLATSAVAHGLFAGNPWSLGIAGGFASPGAAALLREADAVVAFGASLTMWTTRHGRLIAPAARVAQVDLDVDALGAAHRIDVGVVGDAALTAALVEAALVEAALAESVRGWRTPQVRERLEEGTWAATAYDDASDDDHIDPRTLTRTLDTMLPADRVVAVDSGHFMGWPAMYLQVPDAAGFVFTQAFQSVGLGLASAIGAAVGVAATHPQRVVVAALGDGGALMGLADLETAARLRLPLVIVVYDDAAYGAEVHHFGPAGARLDTVRFPETDFAALARALGADAVTVRGAGDLRSAGALLGQRPAGPVVVDAKVVPSVVAEWLEEAFRGH